MRVAQYEYSDIIGSGSFGVIYKGKNVKTGEAVVVKTEPYDIEFSSICHESTIMNLLYSKSCRSIPPTYWYGIIPETKERILVMPRYQESLEDFVLRGSARNPSSQSTYNRNIMRSAISILRHVHEQYVVHRDIKPANWMINRGELMLIDFGMASFYVDSKTYHLPPADPKKTHIIGTPKYASWNVHCGEEYSRRDDIISVIYIGIFLLYGQGLWSDCPAVKEDAGLLASPLNQWFKSRKTLGEITNISVERWPELAEAANAIYNTKFDEKPDYELLENLFSSEKTI